MEESIVIKQNPIKAIGLVIIGVLMTCGCIFLVQLAVYDPEVLYDYGHPTFISLVTGFGVLFFGVATGYGMISMIRNRPLLIIDRTGFQDYSTMAAAGFVSWRNVRSITIYEIKSQRFIGVYVDDPDLLFRDRPWVARSLIKGNLKMGYPPVTIRTNSIKQTPEQVLVAMEAFLGAYRKQ